jgi:hypothetical protein
MFNCLCKLDNITEFTQQILNPKNVLAIEEDRQGSPRSKGEDKNVSVNADLSDSDPLLPLPISPSSQIKSPSAHTSVSLDHPDKDLNFEIIEINPSILRLIKPTHPSTDFRVSIIQ